MYYAFYGLGSTKTGSIDTPFPEIGDMVMQIIGSYDFRKLLRPEDKEALRTAPLADIRVYAPVRDMRSPPPQPNPDIEQPLLMTSHIQHLFTYRLLMPTYSGTTFSNKCYLSSCKREA